MISGGSGACRSRGRREAMPKPVSQTSPVVRLTRILAGLMSLWTRPRWWTLPSAAAIADGEAQKAPHLHRRAEQPVERLAAGVLEHQHGPTALAHELQRPHRPRPVQLVLQSVFVSKAIEGGRCRMLRGGQHDQHGGPMTVGVGALPGRRRVRRPPTRPGGYASPSAPNQEDGFICRIRRQVGGRHLLRRY